MPNETPSKLIALLQKLITETDKMNIGKIYIAVAEEVKSISFVGSNPYPEIVYKHLIKLSIKDFIHSGRSEDSANVIKDVIAILSATAIATR